MNSTRRLLLITAGSLCVVLAAVGMLIPVLPTTPFLLLAAFFYARSSQRFYTWLITNRLFGEYIRCYREGLGWPLRLKLMTIALLWLSIGSAAAFAVSSIWMRLGLLLIAAGVTVHLAYIKTRLGPAPAVSPVVEPKNPAGPG